MAENIAGIIPGGGSRTYRGVIVRPAPGAPLAVNVMGNVIPCSYADPLVVNEGDPVQVEMFSRARGQSEAIVRSRISPTPRPGTARVSIVPPGSNTITVVGDDGATYVASFTGTYAVNDQVILQWNSRQPTVVGKVSTTAAPPPPAPPPPPPPPAPTVGTTPFVATDSGTWVPAFGSWDSWAGGGGNLFQGQYGSGQLYGAWFYGGAVSQLAGRTITRIQFTLGARRRVGSYNAPVAVHLYAHSNSNKPGGDVARIGGPMDATIDPGAGTFTFDIPTTWAGFGALAAALQSGGGIAIAGDPYASFEGRRSVPDSGKLIIDWARTEASVI